MTTSSTPTKKPRVIIIGAGFAGLEAARGLKGAPVKVTLLDRNNYHLFQPLLYQVATAGLTPKDIAASIRTILRRQDNLEFCQAEVTDLDLKNRRVITDNSVLNYDYLIFAPGGTTNYFGLASLAEHSLGLKSLNEAVAIRNHVLRLFELAVQEEDAAKRRALLSFTVVGGGPTGVELAGALSELIYTVLVRDYRRLDFAEARIRLLEASDTLLPSLPESLRNSAIKTLQKKKIEIRFGAAVTAFDGQALTLKTGEIIPGHTLIWAAGVKASPLVDKLGVQQGSKARAIVAPTLQLTDYPEVLVSGDAALVANNSQPVPMTAVAAMQTGSCAARNIKRLLQGRQPEPFVFHDLGNLATIGRNAAVGKIGWLKLRGFFAWLIWSAIHVVRLAGFRNRMFVFWSWFWDYILYDRSIRIITRE